ncbi:hypothetical protein [Polyangium jinanense]|uniref:Uncharacterized protein n=1 Tax=Polyangium jinanense TaxID=2829994 RepID=A0A9X3X9Z6_9BACT|nr:hypothetical protein [Polyangium jinanense]MDC3960679.1 hypothetical protein [Polyangium jinanense]MDC3986967.1 hypothetical protein [Polyangium jinanense]
MTPYDPGQPRNSAASLARSSGMMCRLLACVVLVGLVGCVRLPEGEPRSAAPAGVQTVVVICNSGPPAISSAPGASAVAPADAPLHERLRSRAAAVARALKDKDMDALAALAHPTRGVRFSPYSYVEPSDMTLSPAEIRGALKDPRVRVWGTQDGSGDPIRGTFAGYFHAYVWTHDFTKVPDVKVDATFGTGNMNDNFAEAYPGAHYVELYKRSVDEMTSRPPSGTGMEWESLRIVFDEIPGDGGRVLALVGIIHGAWTI